MEPIDKHPILEIPKREKKIIKFEGKEIEVEKGITIATALHRAGFPIHSYSLTGRPRSLMCGIGKCSACEMIVDGEVKRICITKVDDVSEVWFKNKDILLFKKKEKEEKIGINKRKIYYCDVAIIGGGPSGLAAREVLNNYNVSNILIDNNSNIGGQFLMQTHQFFFYEKEKKFGGLRGYEIANKLVGNNTENIFLNTVVWDILEDNLIGCKNLLNNEVFYIKSDYVIIAVGAIPFLPDFINNDLPGVYTAAVVQKMMNLEHTLLGKRVITVGAGNIGYLTSYQLTQAGAKVLAILEAAEKEGGFPVQANRIKRLGIKILTSKIVIKAIPNKEKTALEAVVIADCKNFVPIPNTEKIIRNIDILNICTGLIPDNKLLNKAREIFGHKCFSIGDSYKIGEGTTAVLHGKKVAYEILELMNKKYDYKIYLEVCKDYIESQKQPEKILETFQVPPPERKNKPFVIIDCTYAFACNPCVFVCPQKAISKNNVNSVVNIDYNLCTGCMECVHQCPGLAIFGFIPNKNIVLIPIEHFFEKNEKVLITNNEGEKIGEGIIENIIKKKNKTNIAYVKVLNLLPNYELIQARGIVKEVDYNDKVVLEDYKESIIKEKSLICHCEDVSLEDLLNVVKGKKVVSVDELKHTVRIGMGECRGLRCINRVKQVLLQNGIELIGDVTPRAPMACQINLSQIESKDIEIVLPKSISKTIEAEVVIGGGGIAGSSLFRYFSEAGLKTILINKGLGSSWRNISGGRIAFTLPQLSELASKNLEIFKDIQSISNINLKLTRYITFAHDNESIKEIEHSARFTDSYIIEPKDFKKEISPFFEDKNNYYKAALITKNCWQFTPGLLINALRKIGEEKGGIIFEHTEIIDLEKIGKNFKILIKNNDEYIQILANYFVNALGSEAHKFASKIGININVYPVRHQAFITKRLPPLGINNDILDMLIDRRKNNGFSAVYGQQLYDTGQIIGCASPIYDEIETNKNIKINTKNFLEYISNVFINWLPILKNVSFQAVWSGYYLENRYIIDPELGLFVGLRGHGLMLSQYLAKKFVDSYLGKEVESFFTKLKLNSEGLTEISFK